MMKILLGVILMISLASQDSWAQSKKRAKAKKRSKATNQEVEIPVNIGVGPAFFFLPGPLTGVYTGVQIEIYAAISEELVQANLHKVPKKYRSLAKNVRGETKLQPFPLPLIPQALIIAPRQGLVENEGAVYGALWKTFGLGLLSLGESSEFMSVRSGVSLPSAMYLYLDHPDLDDSSRHVIGLGGDLSAQLQFRFSPKVAIHFSGVTQGFLTNKYSYLDEGQWKSEQFFYVNRLSMVFNYRFGYKTKLN